MKKIVKRAVSAVAVAAMALSMTAFGNTTESDVVSAKPPTASGGYGYQYVGVKWHGSHYERCWKVYLNGREQGYIYECQVR